MSKAQAVEVDGVLYCVEEDDALYSEVFVPAECEECGVTLSGFNSLVLRIGTKSRYVCRECGEPYDIVLVEPEECEA